MDHPVTVHVPAEPRRKHHFGQRGECAPTAERCNRRHDWEITCSCGAVMSTTSRSRTGTKLDQHLADAGASLITGVVPT